MGVYEFPLVPRQSNKNYLVGGLRTEMYCLTVLKAGSLNLRCQLAHFLSGNHRGESYFVSSSFQCCVLLGFPWRIKASLQSHGHLLSVPPHMVIPLYLSVSVQTSLFYKDTSHIKLRLMLRPHFNLINLI